MISCKYKTSRLERWRLCLEPEGYAFESIWEGSLHFSEGVQRQTAESEKERRESVLYLAAVALLYFLSSLEMRGKWPAALLDTTYH